MPKGAGESSLDAPDWRSVRHDSSSGPLRAEAATPESGGHPFPPELQAHAAENAGGWVYDLEPGFRSTGSIPPERIVGAWKIDEGGVPTGWFVPNRQYRQAATSRRTRRRRRVGFILLTALVIAGGGVAAALVLRHTGRDPTHPTPGHGSHTFTAPGGGSAISPPKQSPNAARGRGSRVHSAPGGSVHRSAGASDRAVALHLQLLPTGPVWVCLTDPGGRLLVDGQILQPGAAAATFTAPEFRLFVGNGNLELKVDGALRRVPLPVGPTSYKVTRQALVAVPAPSGPPCP
jgi:hypothetical protein